MDLVRDLLDKAVVDRNGREMGRVDGAVLQARPGAPPRLAAIVIGPAALAYRLHPRIGRAVSAVERWLGWGGARPVRIDAGALHVAEGRVHVRPAIGETEVDAIERRLRGWISRIPGSR